MTRLVAMTDRLIRKAPWLVLAVLGAGVLPGYAWWLATGDAAAAKRVLRLSLSCSYLAMFGFIGFIQFCLPFYGAQEAPPLARRLAGAALGAWVWGTGAFAVSALSHLPLLAAARLATAVFAAGFVAGLALQRHTMRGGDGSGTGK